MRQEIHDPWSRTVDAHDYASSMESMKLMLEFK